MQEESQRKIAEIEENERRVRGEVVRSSSQKTGASERCIGQLGEEARRKVEEINVAAREAIDAKKNEAAELERAAMQEKLCAEENFEKAHRELEEKKVAAERAWTAMLQPSRIVAPRASETEIGVREFPEQPSFDVGEWPEEAGWPDDHSEQLATGGTPPITPLHRTDAEVTVELSRERNDLQKETGGVWGHLTSFLGKIISFLRLDKLFAWITSKFRGDAAGK
jgi:hypothetical protein